MVINTRARFQRQRLCENYDGLLHSSRINIADVLAVLLAGNQHSLQHKQRGQICIHHLLTYTHGNKTLGARYGRKLSGKESSRVGWLF